jgi:hypothetical protein
VTEVPPTYTVEDVMATAAADQRDAATKDAIRSGMLIGQIHGAQVAGYWLTLRPHMPVEVAANLTNLYVGTIMRDGAKR